MIAKYSRVALFALLSFVSIVGANAQTRTTVSLYRAWTVLGGVANGYPAIGDVTYRNTAAAAYSADQQNLSFDIYSPPQTTPATKRPVVIFIHGGGFTSGDKSEYQDMALYYAQLGFVTVTVNYRLAVSAISYWPAQLYDVQLITNYLKLANEAQTLLSIDNSRFTVVGGSAGGLMAAFLADDITYKNAVAKVVTFGGPWDIADVIGDLILNGTATSNYTTDAKGMALNLLTGGTYPTTQAGLDALIQSAKKATPNYGYASLNKTYPGIGRAFLVRGALDTLIPLRQAQSGYNMVTKVSGLASKATYYEFAGVGHAIPGDLQHEVLQSGCVLGEWAPSGPIACQQ